MKKVIWKSLEVNLVAGETVAEGDIHLERGERIVAAASVPVKPGKVVTLGLFENGQLASPSMDLGFWERSNAGHYLDGFKPIEYKGGTTITARLATKVALAADCQVQVVFGIIQEDSTCD